MKKTVKFKNFNRFFLYKKDDLYVPASELDCELIEKPLKNITLLLTAAGQYFFFEDDLVNVKKFGYVKPCNIKKRIALNLEIEDPTTQSHIDIDFYTLGFIFGRFTCISKKQDKFDKNVVLEFSELDNESLKHILKENNIGNEYLTKTEDSTYLRIPKVSIIQKFIDSLENEIFPKELWLGNYKDGYEFISGFFESGPYTTMKRRTIKDINSSLITQFLISHILKYAYCRIEYRDNVPFSINFTDSIIRDLTFKNKIFRYKQIPYVGPTTLLRLNNLKIIRILKFNSTGTILVPKGEHIQMGVKVIR